MFHICNPRAMLSDPPHAVRVSRYFLSAKRFNEFLLPPGVVSEIHELLCSKTKRELGDMLVQISEIGKGFVVLC